MADITTGSLSLYFPGDAKGKQRPRATTINGKARMYTPKQTTDAEHNVAAMAFSQVGQPLLEGPLSVVVDITVRPPQSWSKRKTEQALSGALFPTGKPDLDNVAKLYLDALNGILWVDDAQIVKLIVLKQYGEKAGVGMIVEQIC